jgi:undecaprenyl-phosphate galactose phosphotransferase
MYKNYLKRIMDFIIALIAIPLVLLIIVIMSPIIYFNDKGPVFYNAPRLGMNGKKFKMLKFRSMYINSPDLRNSDGSTFNSSNDPRVTKVGKFMRKTSLDEIPQIFNVLIGQMSLVGPRPTLATKNFLDISEDERKRYTVRPGITGYSQAYYRNSISQSEKFRQDNYYVDNISFLLDAKIIIKTVASVLKHDNVFVSEENKLIENKSEDLEVNRETIHK